METISQELFDYTVAARRYLHQYPETNFDLENTARFVREELQKMGIEPTDKYGKCSLVADLGPEGKPVLGIRADMDALPVTEKVDVPYKSKIPGRMHACGHDTHTAVLLAVAKTLKPIEDTLPCRVRLIFQPAEESTVSGAKMMVDNGVLEGVDAVVCTHCENTLDAGWLGMYPGDYMAACAPIHITFLGKTSHATIPEAGVDAIAMAHEAYTKLKETAKEEAGDRTYIWSVGTFQGGTAHNVIADRCDMDISFRFYDNSLCEVMEEKTREICQSIAEKFGGKVELDWKVSTVATHNDETMVHWAESLLKQEGYQLCRMPQKKSSEDFGWMLSRVKGMIFRYGTRNEAMGCTSTAHKNDFCVDERGMKTAIGAFVTIAKHADEYFEMVKE